MHRLLSAHFHSRLVRVVDLLPAALRGARQALFPDNALAPARPPPSEAEVAQIRHDCAGALVAAVPAAIRPRFFGPVHDLRMRQHVETQMLDRFADAYLNKHLIVAVVDLLAVRLFPELLVASEGYR